MSGIGSAVAVNSGARGPPGSNRVDRRLRGSWTGRTLRRQSVRPRRVGVRIGWSAEPECLGAEFRSCRHRCSARAVTTSCRLRREHQLQRCTAQHRQFKTRIGFNRLKLALKQHAEQVGPSEPAGMGEPIIGNTKIRERLIPQRVKVVANRCEKRRQTRTEIIADVRVRRNHERGTAQRLLRGDPHLAHEGPDPICC